MATFNKNITINTTENISQNHWPFVNPGASEDPVVTNVAYKHDASKFLAYSDVANGFSADGTFKPVLYIDYVEDLALVTSGDLDTATGFQ